MSESNVHKVEDFERGNFKGIRTIRTQALNFITQHTYLSFIERRKKA